MYGSTLRLPGKHRQVQRFGFSFFRGVTKAMGPSSMESLDNLSAEAGRAGDGMCFSHLSIVHNMETTTRSSEYSHSFFPTLAVGLLDFKADVILARLEADFSDQPPSIPAVPNRRVSLQCRTAGYPCSAPPLNILGSAQPQNTPAVPNHQVSLQCPTAEWSAQQQSINILAAHLQCCKEDN